MIIQNDVLEKILFRMVQYNWSEIIILSSVNKQFYEQIKINKNKMSALMEIPFDFKTSIAYYIDREDDDLIEYLIGTSKIKKKYSKEQADSELKAPYMIKDEFGSNRELCPIIFSNLYPNKNFGPNITGMDIQYDDVVKYWKGNDGNLVKENIKSTKIKNDDNIKLSEVYWLYVLEELCHYCKTFSYVILPYYDPLLASYKNARVHTIYEIKTSEDFELYDDNI